jgi:hypothetical protein
MADGRKRLDQAHEGAVGLVGLLASVLLLAITIGLAFVGKATGIDAGAIIRGIDSVIGDLGVLLLSAAAIGYGLIGWICCLHIVRAAFGYRGDGSFWP